MGSEKMISVWGRQLSPETFSLSLEDRKVFVLSQWQKSDQPNIWYLLYRLVISTFLLSSLVVSIVDPYHTEEPYMFRVKWLIYLTNWGFGFCTLQSLLGLLMIYKCYNYKDGAFEEKISPKLYKTYWVCNIIATDVSIGVSALYWSVIYNGTMALDYINVVTHAMNSVVMLLELCVVSHPVKLGHVHIALIFGFAYAIFSIVYFYAGGTSRFGSPIIYRVLDWNNTAKSLAITAGTLFFLIVLHCSSYSAFRLRQWIASKIIVPKMGEKQIPIQDVSKGIDNEALAHEA